MKMKKIIDMKIDNTTEEMQKEKMKGILMTFTIDISETKEPLDTPKDFRNFICDWVEENWKLWM